MVRLLVCKGKDAPILEIDSKRIAERLSPGTIREPDFYELFRRKGNVLVACPRGKVRSGTCTVPLRALRIYHDAKARRVIRDCKSGTLAKRRAAQVQRIIEDMRRPRSRRRMSRGLGIEESGNSMGRLAQFVLQSMIGATIAVLVFKFIFPGAMEGGKAPVAPGPGMEDR